MRILLTTLNSKYIHSNLAIKYLYAAAAEQSGLIDVKEFTINNDDDYIFTELLRGDYGVICFSCYIWNVERILYLSENLKKAQPGLLIVLGGPEVSFDTLELIKERKSLDFVLCGEGEFAFRQLCAEFAKEPEKRVYDKIKGLVYRLAGKIYVNPPAEPLLFESVPFPYNYFACEEDKILYYESARGCPFQCSYCLSSLEKKVRSLPLSRVKMDLSYFIHKNVKQVKFIDRTFNWDRERCAEILDYLIHMDNGKTNYHFEMCGELLSEEIIGLLGRARPGLFQLEIGIQSVNPKTLRAVGRSDNIAVQMRNIRRAAELPGVHVHVDLIAGLPFEDYDSFRNSFNLVCSLSADAVQLGFLKLLKGTRIREEAEAYGYRYRSNAPYEVICNRFISAKDIARLKQMESIFDLYYNRGGFVRTLKYLIGVQEKTPFDFYEEFSDFYHLKGYQHRSHKKEDLYRILYKYAKWKDRSLAGVSEGAMPLLEADMADTLNFDAVKKFKGKGWNIL